MRAFPTVVRWRASTRWNAPVSATAAWLLVPYLAWVSFATALNGSVWLRNRESILRSAQ